MVYYITSMRKLTWYHIYLSEKSIFCRKLEKIFYTGCLSLTETFYDDIITIFSKIHYNADFLPLKSELPFQNQHYSEEIIVTALKNILLMFWSSLFLLLFNKIQWKETAVVRERWWVHNWILNTYSYKLKYNPKIASNKSKT